MYTRLRNFTHFMRRTRDSFKVSGQDSVTKLPAKSKSSASIVVLARSAAYMVNISQNFPSV